MFVSTSTMQVSRSVYIIKCIPLEMSFISSIVAQLFVIYEKVSPVGECFTHDIFLFLHVYTVAFSNTAIDGFSFGTNCMIVF